MLIDLFLLTFIVVFIIDISGIVESIEKALSKWLKGKVRLGKPWTCSLCMSWWVNLIYLLCVGEFTLLWIATVALFAHLSHVLATFMVWVRETLIYLIEKAYNALK